MKRDGNGEEREKRAKMTLLEIAPGSSKINTIWKASRNNKQ